MKLRLLNLQSETQMLQRTNTGSLNIHFPCHCHTKINAALNQIGLQANLLDPCLYTGHIIDPSNPDVPPLPHPHSPSFCTQMTLFISPKTPRLNGFSNLYSLCLSRSTLWEQWNGFLAHTSNRTNRTTKYQFTSAKSTLQHIWLRILIMLACATSHPMPPCIIPVCPSTQSLNPMKMKTVLPPSSTEENIKVWLTQSDG